MELQNAVKQYGSITAAAKALDMPRTTFRRRLNIERLDTFKTFVLPEPTEIKVKDKVQHFIVSYAQDKTALHEDFWTNLQAYSKYLNAEIYIAGGTYSKSLFENTNPETRAEGIWFHEDIEDHIIHDPIAFGDNLLFCAEATSNPTAVNPLSGMETYTKSKWGIFPHTKVQMRSVATQKNLPSKQIFTTGSVTLPNYIRAKAGIKAQHHHQVGAMLVSLDTDGSVFCRHLLATDFEDGTFYDLDIKVSGGKVTKGHRPEAIIFGDIHIEKIDPEVSLSSFGYDKTSQKKVREDSLSDYLKPKIRVFHDLIDFETRNHHNINSHHHRLRTFYSGNDTVIGDLSKAVSFMNEIYDEDIEDYIIQSNHDNALLTWLRNKDVRNDPANYIFWLETELKYCKSIRDGVECHLFREVLEDIGISDHINWIREDQDNLVVFDVELGIHGHNGANGQRGSAASFNKMGPKVIIGHGHSPEIMDGYMRVGTNSLLDMGYNKGLSSWSHSNGILYANGQRTIITKQNGKWYI